MSIGQVAINKTKWQCDTVTPNLLRLELQLGFQSCRPAAPDALLARDPKIFNIRP